MSLETFGRYELLKKIATGGMAQIYFAKETLPDGTSRHVVVKRILPHMAENVEFIRMFLDEARIAGRLNHPNVVQIFDLGSEGDSFFLAMEFIHGDDVRRLWKHSEAVGQPLPVPLICRIIADCAAGLDYAHKKTDANGRPLNIVHRDISPQNILVSFEGQVKVVDFGIAKAADQSTVTRSGVLKGKYSYMSPEQAAVKRRTIDCRTDIFALGIVLYELLTGTRLFKRSNDIQTLNAVTDCEVMPPSEVNLSLPEELDAIVLKALAKEPEDRFQEAQDLQHALEEWIDGQSMPARQSDVAAFMKRIYAERLRAEAEEGELPAPVSPSSDNLPELPAEKVAPPKKASKQIKAPKLTPVDTGRTRMSEPTLTERPPTRAVRPTQGELSQTTLGDGPNEGAKTNTIKQLPDKKGSNRFALIAALAALVMLIFFALAWKFSTPTIAPVTPPTDEAAGETGDAGQKQTVTVSFSSAPSGAALSINGIASGVTPIDVELNPGSTVLVQATAEGFVTSTERLTIGTDPSESHAFELTPLTVEPPQPPPALTPEKAATGGVRFFAKPWATVECGPYKLGRTPTAERQLAVGIYTCVFAHPPNASQKKIIRITPDSHQKVSVSFEAGAFE